ncbi:hypothetical protein J6590_070575 [Homalodisca vitripennis]|nr:hypothetical protein J6590_070575 [Homalodisca vitripennis]
MFVFTSSIDSEKCCALFETVVLQQSLVVRRKRTSQKRTRSGVLSGGSEAEYFVPHPVKSLTNIQDNCSDEQADIDLEGGRVPPTKAVLITAYLLVEVLRESDRFLWSAEYYHRVQSHSEGRQLTDLISAVAKGVGSEKNTFVGRVPGRKSVKN